jgi:hypothetical protein
MYSGTSSVPKISSGSKSRLEKGREGETMRLQSKAQEMIDRILTLE